MIKVFIDGSAGTTGLRIFDRLQNRKDIEIISLPENLRKDTSARSDCINSADIAFLCLPDAAAVEAVSYLKSDTTKVIDTSTAHRTNDAFAYGFPELKGYREKIKSSNLIANPGCHASGFIALVKPLIDAGLISNELALTSFSLTGYSGAGKAGIAKYEQENRPELLDAPGQYGLTQEHKHLPEMVKVTGLKHAPAFCPIIAPFYSGMEVTVPVFIDQLKGTVADIKELYASYYGTTPIGTVSGLVRFKDGVHEDGFLYANAFSNRDDMEITVCGNDDRILLVARYDNLGKGASGAAIQNMNIITDTNETEGLDY